MISLPQSSRTRVATGELCRIAVASAASCRNVRMFVVAVGVAGGRAGRRCGSRPDRGPGWSAAGESRRSRAGELLRQRLLQRPGELRRVLLVAHADDELRVVRLLQLGCGRRTRSAAPRRRRTSSPTPECRAACRPCRGSARRRPARRRARRAPLEPRSRWCRAPTCRCAATGRRTTGTGRRRGKNESLRWCLK